jgi:hypothetical protein
VLPDTGGRDRAARLKPITQTGLAFQLCNQRIDLGALGSRHLSQAGYATQTYPKIFYGHP